MFCVFFLISFVFEKAFLICLGLHVGGTRLFEAFIKGNGGNCRGGIHTSITLNNVSLTFSLSLSSYDAVSRSRTSRREVFMVIQEVVSHNALFEYRILVKWNRFLQTLISFTLKCISCEGNDYKIVL